MPQFSVIIPCYNSARWIQQALDSVFAQSSDDLEVIAVDDGSTDATFSLLKSYGRGVRVLSQPNKGAGAARNLAASVATGDYFATLDADDIWFPWTLDVYREVITQFHRPSIIAGRPHRFSDVKELREVIGSKSRSCLYPNFYEAARQGFWFLLPSSLLIRRDVFDVCCGFAERKINSEDTHLFLKFGMTPDFVAVLSPQLFGYRFHGGSAIFKTHLSFAGCQFLIDQERTGVYPGGGSMQGIRHSIITKHCRSASLACLRAGSPSEGLEIYIKTIRWNLALGRIRYLLGFPFVLATTVLKKCFASDNVSDALGDSKP